jgi:carbonic anhydrase/acetyltransferase-like protein (isoleucine patch superfamily)
MIQANHAGQNPKIDETAYVHPTAVVIGNVEIGAKAYIGPNAVIRSDEPGPDGVAEAIVIESEVNIQDGVIIHALAGSQVRIRKGVSVAHGAVVHGPCDIGEGCFIGFRSVVFKTAFGRGVIVQHLSLVEGVDIPAGMHVPSMTSVLIDYDLRKLKPASPDLAAFADEVRRVNVFLAENS